MKPKEKILALIPARGGSKRIPRKNVRELWGKPLLAYSIQAALQSNLVDRVICTTDDPEIAASARECGAEVPFIRPREIAADRSADAEFYLHALDWLGEHEGYRPDVIANFRPTNPLRRPLVVDDILELLLRRPDVDSVRTVNRAPVSVFSLRTIDAATGLIHCPVTVPREGPFHTAVQPLPETYRLNAYLDATWVEAVLRTRSSLGQKMLPYILAEDPIDIDTEADWANLAARFSSFDAYLEAEGG